MVDHDLRLGLRALRQKIVGPDQLCEAMEDLVRGSGSSLSMILRHRGWASQSQIDDLEAETDEGETARFVGTFDGSMSTVEHRSNKAGSPPGEEVVEGPARAPAAGGRYEKIRIHATGGLGRVWLALDHHLGRELALKELRDDRRDDPRMIGRFLEEARITARLEHPGIVPIHDLIEGEHEGSPPFHTMRFLSGRTLDEAVEAHHGRREAGASADPRGLRNLLDAFRSVCQAVAYAHSREVVHRDLKGRNVILGDFGEVFVVDWGLAKPVGPDKPADEPSSIGRGPAADRTETEPGSILGTPGFLAPELLDGRPADRRSDVYSLGAILYLILTGRAPYSDWGRLEVLKVVHDRDPVHPRSLVRDAPPALVAICRKAMARDPSGRYASADEVAEEVRRWLADEPVSAHPEPLPDRLARWGRRHRAAVFAASAVMVLAVVGLSTSTALIWAEQRRTAEQKVRADAQRALAEGNLALSRQLSLDLLRIADQRLSPIRGTERARAEIFDTSLRTFRSFLRQKPDDPTLRSWTAQVARYSANVHRLLDESDLAGSLYLGSIELLESLAGQFPREFSHRSELAMVLGDHAQLLGRLGRLREAAGRSRESVQAAESLAGQFPDRPESVRVLAKALFDRASIEGRMGRPAESARLIEKAVTLYDGLLALPEGLSNAIDPLMMGSSLHLLAVADRELGRGGEGLAAVDRGLALMRSSLEKDADENNAEHLVDRLLLERARIGSGLEGRRDQAMDDLGRAIESWARLSGGYPRVATYRASLAEARQARGALRAASGQLGPAGEDLEASRQGLESLANKSAEIPAYRADLGRTYLEQGRLALLAGQSELAVDRLEKAAGMLRRVVDQAPDDARDRPLMEAAVEELARARRAVNSGR